MICCLLENALLGDQVLEHIVLVKISYKIPDRSIKSDSEPTIHSTYNGLEAQLKCLRNIYLNFGQDQS